MARSLPTQMVCCGNVGCTRSGVEHAGQLQSNAQSRRCAVPDDRDSMVPDREFPPEPAEALVGRAGSIYHRKYRRCGLYCNDSSCRRFGTAACLGRIWRLAVVVWPATVEAGTSCLAVNARRFAASKQLKVCLNTHEANHDAKSNLSLIRRFDTGAGFSASYAHGTASLEHSARRSTSGR